MQSAAREVAARAVEALAAADRAASARSMHQKPFGVPKSQSSAPAPRRHHIRRPFFRPSLGCRK